MASIENGTVIGEVAGSALPLRELSDFEPLLERAESTQFVAIGENSHGAHESREMQAQFTRLLITELGFSHVLIEADQQDMDLVDRSVRHLADAPTDPGDALYEQQNWPSWMWATEETASFCRWLRDGHNRDRSPDERASWGGLDRYPLWGATKGVLRYLSQELGWTPGQVNEALDAPLRGKSMVPAREIGAVANYLATMLTTPDLAPDAESYYQTYLRGGSEAMNARSTHWIDTVSQILSEYGADSRVVLWAHNTHVGDSRGNILGTAEGFKSIGQLLRHHFSGRTMLVGFAGGAGSIVAARQRGATMETVDVPVPRGESLEALLSEVTGDRRALFTFPEQRTGWLTAELAHRAIGAVYEPERDDVFYIPARLGLTYDALGWFPNINPVDALHSTLARQGVLETLRVSE